VHGDTQKEDEAELNRHVMERGDEQAVERLMQVVGLQSQVFPTHVLDWFRFHLKAGWGVYPLVGTPDHIASELIRLSDIGFDGILLSWVDYLAGLGRWNKEVMPLLGQAGLRQQRARSEAA